MQIKLLTTNEVFTPLFTDYPLLFSNSRIDSSEFFNILIIGENCFLIRSMIQVFIF